MSHVAAKSALENIRAQLKADVEAAVEKAKLAAVQNDLTDYADVCEHLDTAEAALIDFLCDGFYETETAVDVFIDDRDFRHEREHQRIELSMLHAAE